MRKSILFPLLFITFVCLTSMAVHKFYVSIYQINYASEKKMIQITSRIFIDDLNNALEQHFHKKTHVGEIGEKQEDVDLLKKYLSEKFSIKINSQKKDIAYLSKALEGTVVICYLRITSIPKISTIEISNSALMELNSEQQNIIQTNINGKKQSLLLTDENVNGILKTE